jgi:hypothetical protein
MIWIVTEKHGRGVVFQQRSFTKTLAELFPFIDEATHIPPDLTHVVIACEKNAAVFLCVYRITVSEKPEEWARVVEIVLRRVEEVEGASLVGQGLVNCGVHGHLFLLMLRFDNGRDCGLVIIFATVSFGLMMSWHTWRVQAVPASLMVWPMV